MPQGCQPDTSWPIKAILLPAQNCGTLPEITQAFYVLVRNTQESVTPSKTIPQNGTKVYSRQTTPENSSVLLKKTAFQETDIHFKTG